MILKDKIALVTGASRGIGKAIAYELSRNGASIVVNYSKSEKEAQEVVAYIKDNGGNAVAIQAQVNKVADVEEMFKSINKFFNAMPDILINNAGMIKDNFLIRMSEEDWDNVIEVNLKSVFLCTKIAARHMLKKKYGKIINISSVVGFSGNAGQFNYCAAKAGIVGATKAAALELAKSGIRVNAIAPGFIDTDMTLALSDDVKSLLIDKVPLKTAGTIDDIAHAALYLSSPYSDYITGQTLHVNGGLYM